MRRFVRRRWFVLSLLGAVGLMLVAVGAKAGSKPNAVVFTLDFHLTGPDSAAGDFTVSGAINDSGTGTETFRFVPNMDRARTIHGVKTLEGAQGTITMEFHVHITPTGEWTAHAKGGWVIKSGTGAYENLHGAGKAEADLDMATGAVTAEYTGTAVIDNRK